MIKLIQSSKLKIPIVYLVENSDDLKELPLGIPFIKATMKEYNQCVQMLEWEVLWKSAIESGLDFNWKNILIRNGYKTWNYGIASSGGWGTLEDGNIETINNTEVEDEWVGETIDASEFINDISYKVDIEVLKNLKLIPSWLNDIETAVKENITNSIVYNPSLYTKKLELPLGDYEYSPSIKNVIIIDISGSIPRGISKTLLNLAKTLAEQFYADLLITGGTSELYPYENVDGLDVDNIYSKHGLNNDQIYFKKIIMEPRKYKTAIVFGDNDEPGYTWCGNSTTISEEKGKELCKWEIENMLSFHTTSDHYIAGYGRWFNTTNITHMKNWVIDLN